MENDEVECFGQSSGGAISAPRDWDRKPGDADADDVSGTIRRVRRLAKRSQRELAHDLGVSQSAVAKWETGRTTPSARMLQRILAVARLSPAALTEDGEVVKPMKDRVARDAAGRRFPAHTFVWAEGWWAPDAAASTPWLGQILLRSAELEQPRVRYSRWWPLARPPSPADASDHPTWQELVAEAREGWQLRRRPRCPIPGWALQDSHRSRNRRPTDYRTGRV